MRKQVSVFVIVVLLIEPKANATTWGIPDSDTWLQLQTYWENLKQTLQLGKILAETREILNAAIDTSRAANAAVKTVKNVGHIINNPADFLENRLREFDDAFPDATGTYRDILTLKSSISELRGGDDYYDPFALQEALFYARKSGTNVYEIKSRLLDKDKVSSPHDAIANELRDQRRQVDSLFDDLETMVLGGLVTPQMAVVFQARASAQQARASVIAAAHQNEMARLAKIRFNNDFDEKLQREDALNRELKNFNALIPKDLSLKPWR